jgi:hypothetical protein
MNRINPAFLTGVMAGMWLTVLLAAMSRYFAQDPHTFTGRLDGNTVTLPPAPFAVIDAGLHTSKRLVIREDKALR